MDNKTLIGTNELAKLFGVTDRWIQQLTSSGVLTPEIVKVNGHDVRRYDLIPNVHSYIQYLQEKVNKNAWTEKENELREQKMKAEIALKESQGELHRLKTEIAAGKYISIEEVTLDYTRFFVTFKRFAMSLPSRITGIIGSYVEPLEARHIEKDLTGEIQKLLEAFVVAAVTEQVNGTKTQK